MSYFGDLRVALEKTEPQLETFVAELANEILRSDAYLCICGNGGSAAIANHFAADVSKVMGVRNVTSLCDSTSMLTAVSNDVSYDQVFVEQLKMQVQVDAVICVSSSGGSPNVVNAARYARGIGARVFALSGFSKFNTLNEILKEKTHDPLWNCGVHVDSTMYGIVEDVHMSVLHATIEKIKGMM